MNESDQIIDELIRATELLLIRLHAREKYAQGYRLGRVPESVFTTLEKTRTVAVDAVAIVAKAHRFRNHSTPETT